MPLSCSLVVPSFSGRDWWNYPVSFTDHDFAMGLFPEDFLTPRTAYCLRQRIPVKRQNSGMPNISNDSKHFRVSLDVSHFTPEEVTVKTVDDHLVIHAKHEERADSHGFVSREFTRRYDLPEDVEAESIISSLSRDGILTVQAPKKVLEQPPNKERIVPITMQDTSTVTTEETAEEEK